MFAYTYLFISTLLGISLNAPVQEHPFFEGSLQFNVEVKGKMASMLKENEPNDKLTMHMRGGDYIVQLTGGRYPKTFLFIADSNYEYSVDASRKMAFRYSPHADMNRASAKEKATARPTGKQVEVNGILCDEYHLRKKEAEFLYYVNDEYRVNLDLFPDPCRAKASFLAEGLEGRIPLKTKKRQKDLLVITTASKVSRREFDPDQFRIPQGFTVKGRDYRW